MKTSTLLTAGLYLLLATPTLTAEAADPRYSNGYSAAPARGLFGIPMPQQWSGTRPMRNGYSNGYGQYNPTGYNSNCPNGNCQTGYRGQSVSGIQAANCANGQCATGNCANGTCPTGACASGQCATGNCPNGNCGPGTYSNNGFPLGAQSDWSPRGSRSGLADPYRGSGDSVNRDSWTQRTQRPVLDPLDDALNSRYRRDNLNLRDEYFGNDDTRQYDSRSQSQSRTRLNSNEWNRPARRSLEIPADSSSGIARF